jgi:hypothetical protein
MFWAKVVLALCIQDPDKPVEKPIKPMPPQIIRPMPAPAPMPVPGQQKPIKPKSGTCDRKCHDKFDACPEMAMICTQCRQDATPCATHAKICQQCADKAQVCPYCQKAAVGSRAAAVKKIEEELAKALPDHKVGRALPNELAKKLLPNVPFFMVMHSGSPCKACEANHEPLAAVEFKDDKDSEGTVHILKSEKDLAELLARQKLPGTEEGVLLAAQLAQAMWEPLGGGLTPDFLEKVKIEGGKAVFEFKKGKETHALTVTTQDGLVRDLIVEKK